MSRLDYCNSVLAGLPQSTLQPLQRVQNSAARLICDVPYHEHITPHLRELHWLPVCSRIEHKLCLTMYNVHNGRCPSYLSRHVPAGRYSITSTSSALRRLVELHQAATSDEIQRTGVFTFWSSGMGSTSRAHRQLSSLSVFKRELKTILCT